MAFSAQILLSLSLLFSAVQEPPEGMAAYYFGFFTKGPNRPDPQSGQARELQTEHLEHLMRLFQEGSLLASGPLGGDGERRGILIFKADSLEQARQWAEQDPAVQAGSLRVEMHPWWGPEGIGERYREWRRDNPEAEDKMKAYQLALLTRGPEWTPESNEETQALQKRHLEHIGEMAKDGHLALAGPFLDGGDLRGIFIFQMDSVEEARQQAARDPAVKAGRLSLEFRPLWVAEGVFPTPPSP